MSGNNNCCGTENCLGYCSRRDTRPHAYVIVFPKTPVIIGWECLMERLVCACWHASMCALFLPQCFANDVIWFEMKGPRPHVSSEMYLPERWDRGRAHVRRLGGSRVFRGVVMKNPPQPPVSFRGPVCYEWCVELCVRGIMCSV
jgi:hypothetical protein